MLLAQISDLHIKAGDVFRARINGKLVPLFKTAAIPSGHPNHLHPETKRLFHEYEDETMPSGRSRR